MSATGRAATWPRASTDHGVPDAALADSIVTWSQPLVTTVLIVMGALTVRPLGLDGRGIEGLLLLLGCGLFGYVRSVPDRFVPPPVRFGLAIGAAVLAGLLFGFDSESWGVAFAYLVCGHAGFRFEQRSAAAVCALTVLTALIGLLTAPASAHAWPWWTALTVCLPVLTGLARRSRVQAMQAAQQTVAATRRAAESERAAATLAERARIARDIHDVLAHSLSGVSVRLDLADAMLEAGRIDEGRAGVQAARGLVVDGLVEARRAVTTLRDGTLDVGTSLERMVQPGETLILDGDLAALDARVAHAVVRTVQESLTNARRHAPGSATAVAVRRLPAAVVVDVVDAGGDATAPANTDGSGMGLVGIRERVADLRGTCTIGPETTGDHAGGWRVHVELPLHSRDLLEGGSA